MMKIIPLSEGSFTIDKSKLFVPFDEGSDNFRERPAGSLLVEVQPFAVITSNDILLLDTGLGFEKEGRLQLHQNLIDKGIEPAKVTRVLMSHLHKDHAGGVGIERDGLGARMSFPSATYYIQSAELKFAFEKGRPSFIPEELEALKDASNVVLLDGDGAIDGYIEHKVTGAHSPHHQVFWIREENEILFYGADDAPQLHQMKHKFAAKYDFDGKKAMELRQQWWEQGAAEHWNFLFYHDVKNPSWQL